jgi:hypothetical protein
MKIFFILLFLNIANFSCTTNNKKESFTKEKPIIIHDTIYLNDNKTKDWQKGFGLTNDPNIDSIWYKPVSFYLNDENCSGLAFDFYYGYFRPGDNGATQELLKLSNTNNEKLRPFYRWCLNKTLIVSDGALGELVGIPAREYAEKFPDEFFNYLDIDTTFEKYKMWTAAISYSGLEEYGAKNSSSLNKKHIEERMIKSLKVKSEKNITRIKQFALDCSK